MKKIHHRILERLSNPRWVFSGAALLVVLDSFHAVGPETAWLGNFANGPLLLVVKYLGVAAWLVAGFFLYRAGCVLRDQATGLLALTYFTLAGTSTAFGGPVWVAAQSFAAAATSFALWQLALARSDRSRLVPAAFALAVSTFLQWRSCAITTFDWTRLGSSISPAWFLPIPFFALLRAPLSRWKMPYRGLLALLAFTLALPLLMGHQESVDLRLALPPLALITALAIRVLINSNVFDINDDIYALRRGLAVLILCLTPYASLYESTLNLLHGEIGVQSVRQENPTKRVPAGQ